MPSEDKGAIPIGAVAQLTGISSHTLRKWESRHGVIEPIRTPSGRRLYTPEQVRKLICLRELIGRGHQISNLSRLTLAELEMLVAEATGRPEPARVAFRRILVVGPVLSAVFSARLGPERAPFVTRAQPGGEWLLAEGGEWLLAEDQASAQASTPASDAALVIELPTLNDRLVAALLTARRRAFSRLIVVYGFATRARVAQLDAGGVYCLMAPIDLEEILNRLGAPARRRAAVELLANPALPPPRFAPESIARMAALAPKIACECPQHVARLLTEVSAFETYSRECEDGDPAERELHARLRLIAAHARALLEEGLANIARTEGVALEELELELDS